MGRNKTKRAKSLHGLNFGLHGRLVLMPQVYMWFAWGCRGVYAGHKVVHRSDRGWSGCGCAPLFLWPFVVFVLLKIYHIDIILHI